MRIFLVKRRIFSFENNNNKKKESIGTRKRDGIGPSYSSGRSGRRGEILERGKGSNDFERIERGAV